MIRHMTEGTVGRDHFRVSGTARGEEKREADEGWIVSGLKCQAG